MYPNMHFLLLLIWVGEAGWEGFATTLPLWPLSMKSWWWAVAKHLDTLFPPAEFSSPTASFPPLSFHQFHPPTQPPNPPGHLPTLSASLYFPSKGSTVFSLATVRQSGGGGGGGGSGWVLTPAGAHICTAWGMEQSPKKKQRERDGGGIGSIWRNMNGTKRALEVT